jgi:hypothetical protein
MLRIKCLVDRKIISETLSRMGVCNFNNYIIYTSAYLIHLEDCDYLASFKELFKYVNEDSYNTMSEIDFERLNSIAYCLENWKLVECIDSIVPHKIKIDTISFSEKSKYLIKHKIKLRNLEGILG